MHIRKRFPFVVKREPGFFCAEIRLGKTRFDELLSAYIEKPQGKPTLVPESDSRPAMSTAKTDFTEDHDNE